MVMTDETRYSRRLRRFWAQLFFVSGSQHAYIVDCGTSTDGLDRVPDLTAEEIRGAEYLFLTHSHRDHTGAVEFAESAGFAGPVIMSAQTYRQLHYKPKNAVIMDSTAPEAELLPGFSFGGAVRATAAARCGTPLPARGRRLSFPAITGKAILSTGMTPCGAFPRISP